MRREALQRVAVRYGPPEISVCPCCGTKSAWRKRRYEFWWEGDKKMGRWEWVPGDYPETDTEEWKEMTSIERFLPRRVST